MDMWDWNSFSVVLIIEIVFHCSLRESVLWILSYKLIRFSLAPLSISMKLGTLPLQGLHMFPSLNTTNNCQEFLKIKEVYFSENWEIHLMPVHSSWQHVCWATLLETIQ